MSASEPFILHPVATGLLALAILLLGALGYALLPVASLPDIDFPTIQVTASLPGAEPMTMASSVAAPLERRIGEIAGVTQMTSTSSLGQTVIVVQFDLARDIDKAARDVQAAINAAASDLPSDLPGPPTWRKVNPADTPILVLALTSDTVAPGTVYDVANDIFAARISQIPGVGQVAVTGAQKSAVRIMVNPDRLAAMNLGLEAVRNTIAAANADEPVGLVAGKEQAATIAVNDQAFGAAAYQPLIMRAANGDIVRLDAVASVENATENDQVAAWFNRSRAVLIIIFKQPGSNIVETVDAIRRELPQLKSWMPAGINISTLTDRTGTIRASLDDVQMTLMITAALVVVLVFLFLRQLTPTLAAALTVPLSIAGTLAVMALAGYSLDNLSLMALTVSTGFVVDDAIVMIENIARHRELGKSAFQAAMDGAGEIGFTVISISISLIAVFIPLLLMGGLVGRLFHEFAVILSVAIAVSAAVSLTLTPMLCGRFMPTADAAPSRWGSMLEYPVTWLRDRYATALDVVLRHQRIGIIATLGTVVLTLALYALVPKGFFPDQDTGLILGITEAAPDVSFTVMSEKQQQAAGIIMKDPDVDDVGSFIGIGAGNASMNEGRVFINLKPLQQRADHALVTAIIARLRPRLGVLPGIVLYMQAVQDIQVGGRLGKGEYQFTLTDTNPDELEAWVPRVMAALSTIPGVLDTASDQEPTGSRLSVTVDRVKAARLGVSMSQVDAVLDDAFSQRQISTMYTSSDTYHVVLTLAAPWVQDPAALSRLYVSAANGTQMPLSAFARIERTTAPLTVTHDGQFPSATVTFNLAPNLPIGAAVRRIQEKIEQLSPPLTLHAEFEGSAEAFRQSLASEPILLLTAIVTIYIVLGVLYENIVHPITILSALPTAGIGALISLWLVGDALTVIGLIGIILLMGIVKKNAIMLVDFAIEAEREDGLIPLEAVRKACLTRFRPILMTSLAALLGAVPLAFGAGSGSELRQPLGISIVGGLLFSQVLTLFTTPVVYLALGRLFRVRVSRHLNTVAAQS